MTVLIEDSPRNVVPSWAGEACSEGLASGVVLSPWVTPSIDGEWKWSAARTVHYLRDSAEQIWLDPGTHCLQMSGVGYFQYYDNWDLWGGARGDLSTEADQRTHVEKVFAAQDALGVSHLAPTVLLHAAESETSARALDIARIALDLDPSSYVSIAGSGPFWSSPSLDPHIGGIADLRPTGFFLTVVRPVSELPVASFAGEVAGVARTSRSLSAFGPIHVSHGDLAGVPALAAGATSVGSGWDTRQRVCAMGNYAAPDDTASGGSWLQRVTHRGLFGTLSRTEAEVLAAQDAARSAQLLPGALVLNQAKETFRHHLAQVQAIADQLHPLNYEDRFAALSADYQASLPEWELVKDITGCPSAGAEWIQPHLDGLREYGAVEGWA